MWSKVYDWLWNFLSCLGGLMAFMASIPFVVVAIVSNMFVPENPIFRCYDKFITTVSKFVADFSREEGD